jgi:hypothetical protein
MQEDIDYIKYFADNEKKQKRITLSVAFLFTVFACIIIAFIVKFKDQKNTIEELNLELLAANSKLRQDTTSLKIGLSEKTANLDAVSTQNQDLINVVNTLEKNTSLNAGVKSQIENIKSQQKDIEDNKSNFVVYMQYAPQAKEEAKDLTRALHLDPGKYKIPKPEQISSFKFSSTVRYFDKADAIEAAKIADLASKSTGGNYNAQYINLDAPKGQIEIWVGQKTD